MREEQGLVWTWTFEMSTGHARGDVYKLDFSLCLCLYLKFRREIQARDIHLKIVYTYTVSVHMKMDGITKRVMFIIMFIIGNIQS